jgi:hypothetical protein
MAEASRIPEVPQFLVASLARGMQVLSEQVDSDTALADR